MPAIRFLWLNGNHADSSGALPQNFNELTTLAYISAVDCGLAFLPSYFGKFGQLLYLDVRNNNISSIPMNVEKLITDRKIVVYFHNNNKVCKKEKNRKRCEPLCSKYCWHRDHADGICDPACNSKACQYDGGDCID